MFDTINALLSDIRKKKPLILNVTNYVTMNWVANGLLSLGASPIMTQASQEIDELVRLAEAVVINIGTLDTPFIEYAKEVCLKVNQQNKPLILDPVGVGASQFRTSTCLELLNQTEFQLIRGNASEIIALSGASQNTKGVDSIATTSDALESAKYLAKKYNLVVIVSGQTDAIVNAESTSLLKRGTEMMPLVTGSGCLLTAVVASFAAVETDITLAASAAVLFYGVCGEIATKHAKGPATFAMQFIDTLSNIAHRHHYE